MKFTLVSMLFVVTLVLAACGSTPTATPQTNKEAAATPAANGVELQLMGWSSSDAENTRLQKVIDTFNQNNPDIKVQLNLVPSYDEKLQTSFAGGSPPDVFYADSFKLPDYVKAGVIEPAADKIEDAADFYPNLKNAFTLDGTFYCPPKDFSTLALIYNKELFDAAGVSYPTADWTWDDFQAAAKKLTKDKKYGAVFSADFARWGAFLYQSGATVANDDFSKMTINSPEALKALDLYVNMIVKDKSAVQPSDVDSGWNGEAFGKQHAAMAIEGNWIVPFLADQYPQIKYGIAELPAGPGGKATLAFTVCYGVAKDGKHKEAAFKLVNYLAGKEGMKAWTDLGLAMPTRQSLREGWLKQFANLEPFLKGADYAHKWQFRPGFQDVLDSINNGIQEAFAGTALPKDVLSNAETVGQEVLDRAKK